MSVVNLFPAIVFAGPPHSGKSVLAYQLSQRLLALQVEHYLLRAVPDGEGNWYLKSGPSVAGALRARAKTGYSPAYLRHMRRVIAARSLPFLVDIGGQPQVEQLALLRPCTHAVLLYRTPAELDEWRPRLAALDLQIIAELRSTLDEPERVQSLAPLRGVITGLQREPDLRSSGPVFEQLLHLVAGICAYERQHLERQHLAAAPYPPLLARQLGERLGLPPGGEWLPAHLPAALEAVEPGAACAFYGRGPAWLAAALAAHAWPAPFALFDVRYNWVKLPALRAGLSLELHVERLAAGEYDILRMSLPSGVLRVGSLRLPGGGGAGATAAQGLVLSGPLPRWAFAALSRGLLGAHPWIAVHDAGRANRAVIVHSQVAGHGVGDEILLTGHL